MGKKKDKKQKNKDLIKISQFAINTAHGAWHVIGEGLASPVHTIAEAVQMGIEAGIAEEKLRMRMPPLPPSFPTKKEKK